MIIVGESELFCEMKMMPTKHCLSSRSVVALREFLVVLCSQSDLPSQNSVIGDRAARQIREKETEDREKGAKNRGFVKIKVTIFLP